MSGIYYIVKQEKRVLTDDRGTRCGKWGASSSQPAAKRSRLTPPSSPVEVPLRSERQGETGDHLRLEYNAIWIDGGRQSSNRSGGVKGLQQSHVSSDRRDGC